MKKFLSTILAVVMVLGSMAMVVSANDSDYAEGFYYVNGEQYTDFMAAVSAANGGTVIVSGECAFGSRLAVNSSVTLQGVNNATIVPTESFGSTASDTNWKALLNIQAPNVVVNDITFDGTEYGEDITASTDFVPLRCASGTIILNNVTVTGSPRSLMLVGSSSSSATVTANGLYCNAPVKTIADGKAYADVNVVNGTLTLNDGLINGFIGTDKGSNYTGTFVNNAQDDHFTLQYTYYINLGIIKIPVTQSMTSTLCHYVTCYNAANIDANSTDVNKYLSAITDDTNMEVIDKMVEAAQREENSAYKADFADMLLDAANATTDSDVQDTLRTYAETLSE